MNPPARDVYLDPTDASVTALFTRNIQGSVTMLNLVRFRDSADYSAYPELAPATPITGRQAYARYIDIEHTLPFLRASGGKSRRCGTLEYCRSRKIGGAMTFKLPTWETEG